MLWGETPAFLLVETYGERQPVVVPHLDESPEESLVVAPLEESLEERHLPGEVPLHYFQSSLSFFALLHFWVSIRKEKVTEL